MKFSRIFIPAAFCAFAIASVVGCNKEKIELDDVGVVQAGASKTFTYPITDISFGYGSDGMLITSNRKKVYRSDDYGVSWQICTTFTSSNSYIDQLRYTNTGTLPYFVYHLNSGNNAQMYTKVTTGNTWLAQFTSVGSTICHSFYNSSSGYAYIKLPTYNYCLAQTTDFGANYSYVAAAPVITSFLQFTSATQGYAITDQDNFSYTTNGGLSWTTTHGSVKKCTKVSPNGACFIIGLDEKIYKSTDFGVTWSVCFNDPGGNYFTTIDHSDNGLVVVGGQGQLLCSRDSGATWKYLMFEDRFFTLSRLLILGDGSVIGTSDNTVSKYIIP